MITFLLGLMRNEKFWMLVGAAVVLVTIWMMILDYGDKQYLKGVSDERAVWQEAMEVAEARARNAEQALEEDADRRRDEAQQWERERVRLYNQARNQIHEAPDLEGRVRALNSFRSSVRDAGAEDHARARADYLSTVAPDA